MSEPNEQIQGEAQQTNAQQRSEREEKFSEILLEWLQTFSDYYPQKRENLSENTILLYKLGLSNLSINELDGACKEAIKRCKFFPTVAEILESLDIWRSANEAEQVAGPRGVGKRYAHLCK